METGDLEYSEEELRGGEMLRISVDVLYSFPSFILQLQQIVD